MHAVLVVKVKLTRLEHLAVIAALTVVKDTDLLVHLLQLMVLQILELAVAVAVAMVP